MSRPRGDDNSVLPGLGVRKGVPRLSPVVDWGALQLDDVKGFVLSRVDGRTTLGDIVLLSPFPEAQTVAILGELFARGVIDVPGVARPVVAQTQVAAPAQVARPAMPAGDRVVMPVIVVRPAAAAPKPESDPHLLSPEVVARIDQVFAIVSDESRPIDPHALLGVARGADRKELKRAYFKLSKEFHPDRYFAKTLGDEKRRLLRIFNAIKEAYEMLDAAAAGSAK